MAKKIKDPVLVRDHNGKTYATRRAWVLRHALQGNGEWIDNEFRFFTPDELAARRAETRRAQPAPRSNGASEHGRTTLRIVLRPNELTPDTSSAPWVSYPMARRGGGVRGLKAQYPVLAGEGAGLR